MGPISKHFFKKKKDAFKNSYDEIQEIMHLNAKYKSLKKQKPFEKINL